MKTRDKHPHHGIVLSAGYWRVQIRLLDKPRVIRAFAFDADDAARRHDIVMKRMEPFLDFSLDPNFPEDYDNISRATWFNDYEYLENESDRDFRAALMQWYDTLVAEAAQTGFDLETLQKNYEAERALALRRRNRVTPQQQAHLLSKRQFAVKALRKSAAREISQSEWLSNVLTNVPTVTADEAAARMNLFIAFDAVAKAVADYATLLEQPAETQTPKVDNAPATVARSEQSAQTIPEQ